MTWRPPNREDHQVAVLWAICAALLVLLRPVWIASAGLAPPCLWHAWTGWPCPGCGSTRALVRLLRADLPGALALNPLTVFAGSAFVCGGVIAPLWLAFGGPAVDIPACPRPAWAAVIAGVVLANWAWLCASGV